MKINKKEFEKLYKAIAYVNKTSVEKVTADMQSAIDIAWGSNNFRLRSLFPRGKPTLEEFLTTLKNEIQ